MHLYVWRSEIKRDSAIMHCHIQISIGARLCRSYQEIARADSFRRYGGYMQLFNLASLSFALVASIDVNHRWQVHPVFPPLNINWRHIDPQTLSNVKEPQVGLPRKGRPRGTRRLPHQLRLSRKPPQNQTYSITGFLALRLRYSLRVVLESESDRAGRNNEPAKSVVLLRNNWHPNYQILADGDAQAIDDYVNPDGICRRYTIGLHVDVVAFTCLTHNSGFQLCDVCTRTQAILVEAQTQDHVQKRELSQHSEGPIPAVTERKKYGDVDPATKLVIIVADAQS
ncbi:hypothetical protein V1515DRAFT_43996 [Lipomyces mesembrius]